MAKTLALVMVAESLVIAGFYLIQGDLRHAAYWFFSACIVASVTI